MHTNEEALRLIKECEECFVVLATDQNAFVAVHPIPKEEDTLKAVTTKVEAMAAMKTDYEGPTKGRFLNSKDVTLQTLLQILLDDQAETTRVAKRIAIFKSWASCGIDELIDIYVVGLLQEKKVTLLRLKELVFGKKSEKMKRRVEEKGEPKDEPERGVQEGGKGDGGRDRDRAARKVYAVLSNGENAGDVRSGVAGVGAVGEVSGSGRCVGTDL
jgi:hypothetical protein